MLDDATIAVDGRYRMVRRCIYINYVARNKLSPILLLTKGTLLTIIGLVVIDEELYKERYSIERTNE